MAEMITLSTVALIMSVLVNAVILLGPVVNWITNGWVQREIQKWIGLTDIHNDTYHTQIFLQDFGESHNELIDAVIDHHDIPVEDWPRKINVERYRQLIDNGHVESGYFVKSAHLSSYEAEEERDGHTP